MDKGITNGGKQKILKNGKMDNRWNVGKKEEVTKKAKKWMV